MRARLLLALLLLASSGAGCVEEELELALQPDGRGTVQLALRLRADLSKDDLAKGQEGLERRAAHVLAGWEGVSAWSDVSVAAEESRIVIKARGWFEDPAALRGDELQQMELGLVEGQLRLRLRVGLKGGKKSEADPRLVQMQEEEFQKDRKSRQEMVDGMMREFRLRVAFRLPAEPAADPAPAGFELSGRTATAVMEGAAVSAAYARLLDEAARLRVEVQGGGLSGEAAAARLAEFEAGITPSGWRTLTCPAPAASDEERAAFERELQAAKEAWATSPWRERVAQARESR